MPPSRTLRALMRADKAKITDEVWDAERIRGFLNKQAMGQEPDQFSQLLFAYRSMRAEDFAHFVAVFVEAGGNVKARSKHGLSLQDVISTHTRATAFVKILQRYG